jgi:hypothetical protein
VRWRHDPDPQSPSFTPYANWPGFIGSLRFERSIAIRHTPSGSRRHTVTDVGLAVRQLMLLLVTESLTRALYGRRRLPRAEVDEIVENGVELWLRSYRRR